MKVVEDKAKSWSMAIACSDCKSALEIHASDVFRQRLGSFDEFETYFMIECGACKTSITLKENTLPAFVRAGAKQKK